MKESTGFSQKSDEKSRKLLNFATEVTDNMPRYARWFTATLIVLVWALFSSTMWSMYSSAYKDCKESLKKTDSELTLAKGEINHMVTKRDKLDKLEKLTLKEAIHRLQPRLDEDVLDKILVNILKCCKDQNLDPALVISLIFEESSFWPMAESDRGAIGLMQVRYETWHEDPILTDNGVSAVDKLFWIDNNINCGTSILRKYIDESGGNIVRALWRYNSGQTSLPLEGEYYEVDYANKILIRMHSIRERIRQAELDLLMNYTEQVK